VQDGIQPDESVNLDTLADQLGQMMGVQKKPDDNG
jgi:hypothetical protein